VERETQKNLDAGVAINSMAKFLGGSSNKTSCCVFRHCAIVAYFTVFKLKNRYDQFRIQRRISQ